MTKRAVCLLGLLSFGALGACAYPLQSPSPSITTQSCDTKLDGEAQVFTLALTTADGRDIPTTVYAPLTSGTYPLIAFSHGAFAAPDRYEAMLEPLAGAGFVIVAPMHVDSEEFARDSKASTIETWETRHEDMAQALNSSAKLEARLSQTGILINRERVVAMGHSYGALIAQMTGGARSAGPTDNWIAPYDEAVDAVVAWSPPPPFDGTNGKDVWQSMAVPSLSITGTTDVFAGFIETWQDHAIAFESAPAGTAYLWVGEEVDHYFGGVFGRQKPADVKSQRLFSRALSQVLGFIEREVDILDACAPGAMIEGESFVAN